MSGIVGLLNLDGAPLDCTVLRRLTAFLAFRGSSITCTQPSPSIGLGHALLDVDGDGMDGQPFTMDGCEWIVADARIDGRRDLTATLTMSGQHLEPDASDAELILRSYRVWGERCVDRLIGDFTFAIWDSARRKLFCARDHLGIKPLYYAHVGRLVVVSNTLDCVRQHPQVARELHDAAVADFLLFGVNQDNSTTTFRDIRRLPPAHSIVWEPDRTKVRRYWTLSVDEPLVFKRRADYTDRFMELLCAAIGDRLRSKRIGVFMSGGIDSTTLAAVAVGLTRDGSSETAVSAITSVYERLIPDAEERYARQAADYLNIPIRFDVRDDEVSIADWHCVSVHTPEPVENPPAFLAGIEFLKRMSVHARVFLYGEGPDDALRYEWRPYLTYLVKSRDARALARALAGDLVMHPRVPLLSSLRQLAGARREEARWRRVFPDWLDRDFAERVRCRERWDAYEHPLPSPHPIRPKGYQGFSSVQWQQLFEDCDTQAAMTRTQFRHPFLDVRLLQYMLALPVMPWCRRKLILRRALRGALPSAVLRRRKTTVRASADLARVAASGFPRFVPAPDLGRYVNIDRIPTAPGTVVELRAALRPLGLNYWLHDLAHA